MHTKELPSSFQGAYIAPQDMDMDKDMDIYFFEE